MNHLDQHNNKSNAKIRTGMADVLAKIIAIAAGESVGKTFFYPTCPRKLIFNLLFNEIVQIKYENLLF